jgi:hypothetical protein
MFGVAERGLKEAKLLRTSRIETLCWQRGDGKRRQFDAGQVHAGRHQLLFSE